MSCPFAHDDAAYVLGALSPAQRLDFERHLAGCEECKRAVREFAGLPGLLSRVDASLLEQAPLDEPLPKTLLPALSREVRRTGRRRTLRTAGAAAAAAAVVVSGAVLAAGQLDDGDPGAAPDSTVSSASPAPVAARPMVAIGEVPVRAEVRLEPVAWGTRLDLTCTYEPDSVAYELPPAVDYTLFVRTRDGRTEQVGSWRSKIGGPMRIMAATASRTAELASVQVRTPGGETVLELAP